MCLPYRRVSSAEARHRPQVVHHDVQQRFLQEVTRCDEVREKTDKTRQPRCQAKSTRAHVLEAAAAATTAAMGTTTTTNAEPGTRVKENAKQHSKAEM